MIGKLVICLAGLALFWCPVSGAQSLADEPVTVSADHPRLFLRPARLRLLKRERQRTSARWQQFETLVVGAPMPERAFAEALYYQVSGNATAAQQAVAWALGEGNDLRQLALVFDWCYDQLSEPQRHDLEARLQKGLAAAASDDSVSSIRSRALAAIALFDHVPQAPQRELERMVRDWWLKKIAPALQEGKNLIARDDAYPLFELLHAIRDTTNLDLREACPRFFKEFPMEHLVTYYPAVYPASENDFYIGAMREPGDPSLRGAALSRAAELAMVAYDANSPDSQILQGWLMHDRFLMRGTFGAPYEFLWANPYQPGLSYYLAPLVYHNPDSGRLFVRSSWEDTAQWFGDFDGVLQVFSDGRATNLNPKLTAEPLALKEAVVCFGQTERKFSVSPEEGEFVFIVGLEPRHTYQVEVDDEEIFEADSDPGGILEVEVPHVKSVGVRIR
jgi:hypothetical protein